MTFGKSLRSRFWKASIEDEVDNELGFHVEMRTRQFIASGMDPAAAREAAVRRFGNINHVNATCRGIGRRRDRDMRRTEYFSELLQDGTFAFRQLLHNPGFTAVAVLTLALGIGATAAIFSIVHAVVLRPLPVPDPDRVVAIYSEWRGSPGNVSPGNYADGVETASSFAHTFAQQFSSFNIGENTDAERVIGARTTAGFFDVFGGRPALGRVYTAEEDRPGREQVVVLSHRLWTRRFAADPSVVGREIRMSGRPYAVIGVMPAWFDYTSDSEQLWVPMAMTAERRANHDGHSLTVYGRLRDGVTIAQARADLAARAEDLKRRFPRENTERSFDVAPLMEDFVGDYRARLFVLLGAVSFVLLIACGNIANLLLARGAARSGEMAIRAALGAGRGRIVRQLLTESIVLAAVSSVVGLALAAWGIQALVSAAPQGVPRLDQARLDPVVVGFTLALAGVSAILFGLVPALRAGRTDVQSVLKAGGRGAGMGGVKDRMRTALIVGELAVALVLLVGAGLLIRSSVALQRVHTGFEPARVLTARLSLPAAEYAEADRVVQTFDRIAEAARAIPGVQNAAITSQVPMAAGGNGNGLIPEGKAQIIENAIQARLRIATPGYLETMQIPVVRGRPITDADRRGAVKVMVVSESLARAAFPGEDALGKRLSCCEAGPDGKSPDFKTIVGIVRDVRWQGPATTPMPEFYLPAAQLPADAWNWVQRTMYVAVKAAGDPEQIALPLRAAISGIAPGVPLFSVQTMEQRIGDSLATARFNTMLLTVLGVIGLLLAAGGIYGVIAYFVTRRTQEIGVRMALGATRANVLAMIVRQAAAPVAAGIAIGIVGAVAATRLIEAELFSVRPNDPMTFASVAAVLAAVALAACLIPARRAASVDPTRALHTS